ncbi:Hypothetical predicted protein [Cloeon dipterum]|uniref:Chitin-binding type-2 domain-containing protein n=1 Tax=Cloeon dipterum TaxID=197152 RepID=A0A8S1DAI9_9INSE|nr:Hypothetical predicted protein [Cloeon dipterum]
MDLEHSWRHLLLALCLLPLCLGVPSKEDCRSFTEPPSACESSKPNVYYECVFNGMTGEMEIVGGNSPPEIPCSPATDVCYRESKVTKLPTPCGPAPPVCTTDGSFAIRERGCASYYVCVSSGSSYQTVIATCAQGLEFSEATKKCEAAAVAGCSVPTPPPPPTPPKPSTSAPVIPVTPARDCPMTGERFADASCRHFLRCDINNKVVRYQCPWRLKYDETKKLCLRKVNCGTRSLIM